MFDVWAYNKQIEEEWITSLFVPSSFTPTLSSFIYLRMDQKVDWTAYTKLDIFDNFRV